MGGLGQGKDLAGVAGGDLRSCECRTGKVSCGILNGVGYDLNIHEELCEFANVACERMEDPIKEKERICSYLGTPHTKRKWGIGRETGRRERNAGRSVEGWWGAGPAGPVLQIHILLPTPLSPSWMGQPSRDAGTLHLPLPGLSSRSMGSVGMDGCPGPAEFTACTWNT